jgi:methionyl aminopeptidase
VSVNEIAEQVGENFIEESLLSAQKKAWAAIQEVAAAIKPGDTEAEALVLLKESVKRLEYQKMWHPPQIRFGVNTTKPYGKPSEPNVVLQENDLFFLDIGPLFHGYEGDAGKTFVVGHDSEMARLASDAEKVFHQVKDHWLFTGKSGGELYDFAETAAMALGWKLSLNGASGHRVSEFPHALHHKGKLKQFAKKPTANRWILEIHLISENLARGAFFEDIL